MSDDSKRRGDSSHVTIPPELKPFMGREQFPVVRGRDEAELDPEVSAGLAAIDAAFAAPVPPAPIEPPRGVGNVQVHVGATTLPTAKGAAKGAAPIALEPKVSLAIGDAPRTLPAGDRSAPTMEVRIGAFRDAVLGKDAAPASRTVGGGTERLPVLRDGAEAAKDEPKAASPWTKDAGSSSTSARAEDLPSSLRPTDTPAQGVKPPAGVKQRRPGAGTAITIALCAVAAAIGLRALTTRTTAPEGAASHGSVPSATPNRTAPAVRAVPPVPAASGAPQIPSSSTPAMATTAIPTSPVPTAERHPTVRTPATADDPYDAAAKPLPPVTAQPQVTPPALPPALPPHPAPTASGAVPWF